MDARDRAPRPRTRGRCVPAPPARPASRSPGPPSLPSAHPPFPAHTTPGKPPGRRTDTRRCTLDSSARVKPEHAVSAARPWLSVESRRCTPTVLAAGRRPLTCIAAVTQVVPWCRIYGLRACFTMPPCPDCCRFLRPGGRVRERTCGGTGGFGGLLVRCLSCRGRVVTCSMTGRGAARGQPGLPRPAGAVPRPGHDDRLGCPPACGGMRPLSLYRPSAWPCAAGPGAADSGLAGAGRGYCPIG